MGSRSAHGQALLLSLALTGLQGNRRRLAAVPVLLRRSPSPDIFRGVETWDLNDLDVQPRQPAVLSSDEEGRAIAIQLPAGERLNEHQVHERAWLLVLSGAIEVDDSGGATTRGGPGMLALFDPNERHEVRASEDSRLLLLLSPWPGEGHPSQR
jgi:quercetin dioxygenase-like cupin family protein